MQNTKSKPQNNASFGVSSSAVPQSESSSMGAAIEPRHSSAPQSQHTATDGPEAGPSNICQCLRRPTPTGLRTERDHLYATRIEHRASARYSSVPHNTADTQTASPSVAPQTIDEGLVTLRRVTKPEEIRARALMPSNSEACWSGAPYPYY